MPVRLQSLLLQVYTLPLEVKPMKVGFSSRCCACVSFVSKIQVLAEPKIFSYLAHTCLNFVSVRHSTVTLSNERCTMNAVILDLDTCSVYHSQISTRRDNVQQVRQNECNNRTCMMYPDRGVETTSQGQECGISSNCAFYDKRVTTNPPVFGIFAFILNPLYRIY